MEAVLGWIIVFLIVIGWAIYRTNILFKLRSEINELAKKITEIASLNFLVQSCSRCGENEMYFLDISPNARSVEYQCVHCKKKMRGFAGSPEAEQAANLNKTLKNKIAIFYKKFPKETITLDNFTFTVPKSPLPYEQTKREPVTEDMRAEIWRRDGGKCVICGSKNNLEFDHIIPVSKGGSTTVRNLQLLCKSCNLSKGAKI